MCMGGKASPRPLGSRNSHDLWSGDDCFSLSYRVQGRWLFTLLLSRATSYLGEKTGTFLFPSFLSQYSRESPRSSTQKNDVNLYSYCARKGHTVCLQGGLIYSVPKTVYIRSQHCLVQASPSLTFIGSIVVCHFQDFDRAQKVVLM